MTIDIENDGPSAARLKFSGITGNHRFVYLTIELSRGELEKLRCQITEALAPEGRRALPEPNSVNI